MDFITFWSMGPWSMPKYLWKSGGTAVFSSSLPRVVLRPARSMGVVMSCLPEAYAARASSMVVYLFSLPGVTLDRR
jgi:hypothetical protein